MIGLFSQELGLIEWMVCPGLASVRENDKPNEGASLAESGILLLMIWKGFAWFVGLPLTLMFFEATHLTQVTAG